MKRRLLCLQLIFFVVVWGTWGYTYAQEPFNLLIFTDEDSLTIYIADPGLVSLVGLAFRVDDGSGPKTYKLENYAAFRGLPYDNVPTPICFRLVRDTSNRIAPLDCQNNTLLIQRLATADVFWYDSISNVSYLITIMQGTTPQAICPSGNVRCNVLLTPPTVTPIPPTPVITATPTATRTPQTTATLVSAMVIAERGVTRNADWEPYMPYVQELNGVEMVLVPAGCFDMGANDVSGHQCFDTPFLIGRYEVTNAQYKTCVEAGECTPPQDRVYYDDPAYAEHPVVNVDWFQANDYATWAGMRLPTKAEWEYAGRGPDGLFFPWGNESDGNLLNFCDVNCEYDWRDADFDDGYARTSPVGTYAGGAAWVGALDMSGNVWEWVSSLHLDYPYDSSHESPGEPGDNRERVLMGGAWDFVISNLLRIADHGWYVPTSVDNVVGFRCAFS